MKQCIIENITDTKVKMTIYTENTSKSKITEFISKRGTSEYFKRLRRDLHMCKDNVKIIDHINGIITIHEPKVEPLENITDINPTEQKKKKTKYFPNVLVTMEKTDDEINRQRVQDIMLELSMGNVKRAKTLIKKFYGI
jgi:hypothetical protein